MWLASARAADAEPVRQLLLGNHGILAQQGEDLLLTFRHQTNIQLQTFVHYFRKTFSRHRLVQEMSTCALKITGQAR